MSRIFISYKRVDKEKVFKIKDQIESALGEKCWIDIDGIESDAQFKNVIIKAINECEIFLFMYSKAHSKIVDFEKDWTIRELEFANSKGRKIVFVNIDHSSLSDNFLFDYKNKQQIDGTNEFYINKLIQDLCFWLDIKQIEKKEISFSVCLIDYYKRNKKIAKHIMTVLFLSLSLGIFVWIFIMLVDKCTYDDERIMVGGFTAVCENNKWGFVDNENDIVIPIMYDSVAEVEDGYIKVGLNGKYGLIDCHGQEIVPCKYDDIDFTFSDNLIWIKLHGLYGYLDARGKVVIPIKFHNATRFNCGFAIVQYKYNQYFIDSNGTFVSEPYSEIHPFCNGHAVIIDQNGLYGTIGTDMKQRIPSKYNKIYTPANALYTSAQKDGRFGVIDSIGNIIVPFIYDIKELDEYSKDVSLFCFSDGLGKVWINNKCGYVDKKGKLIIPCRYSSGSDFHNGVAVVQDENGNYGMIDKTGDIIVPFEYDYIGDNNSGLISVEKSGSFGLIDTFGNLIVDMKYDSIDKFHEGMAAVQLNGKCGYIDSKGNLAIPIIYQDVRNFSEGHAAVKLNNRIGYIDKYGKVVIPFEYLDGGDFYHGSARVEKDGKTFYINRKGKEISPVDHYCRSVYNHGMEIRYDFFKR